MAPNETQGPKEHCNTAKQVGGDTKLDQQREAKRIETEVEKLVEVQANIMTRKKH